MLLLFSCNQVIVLLTRARAVATVYLRGAIPETGGMQKKMNWLLIETIASDVIAEKILQTVRTTKSLPGYQLARNFHGGVR